MLAVAREAFHLKSGVDTTILMFVIKLLLRFDKTSCYSFCHYLVTNGHYQEIFMEGSFNVFFGVNTLNEATSTYI